MKEGLFSKSFEIPPPFKTTGDYEQYRTETVPQNIISKFRVKSPADDMFQKTLDSTCPPKISKRLKEHVNSFKNAKHHRAPLIQFLIQISAVSPIWHEQPRVIQGELLKFRNGLLKNKHRNTAYSNFQNVKNAVSVLIEHRLLPLDTELPSNLRRCTNTAKIRAENPIISNLNIYSDESNVSFRTSHAYLKDLESDIRENLNILLYEAKKIVHEGYHLFLSTHSIIAKSQRDEFIAHPKMLVKRDESRKKDRKEQNPFYSGNPLSFENKIAALDHFFDLVAQNKPIPHKTDLRNNTSFLGYLGLTPLIASAMQVIITDELGINPYSLYKVKMVSDGHGHEYVKVTDEGSVRLKALKPRGRLARTSQTCGSNIALSKIDASEIDASTCLKMAIEMTSRLRKHTENQALWICLTTRHGAILPTPETFQNSFNTIRNRAALKKPIFRKATLKKIRTSKSVLIYLESNGDSLKAATYLGNHVKTTLDRYIPKYITELIYRIRIRSFQNILLFMSVSSEESPERSLNLSPKEYERHLKNAFENPSMGGQLYKSLTTSRDTNESTDTKYFCVSEKNIGLAIMYARSGTDAELKLDCTTVLEKIAEGPIIMKQLLRKAHITVQEKIWKNECHISA
ncbi:hypothetical protein [Ketobacter sp.]|uniref:hypothetical protein n=1 Tax=Ketobacter sp. TaxID=2083498 RepID=UPI0025C30F2B|nr:hypothetical protein [Ketobacter sp.]